MYKVKNIQVVIGANYGDEGKGLMTDYFAAKDPKSLVVRFNGGAQAGHTVVLNNPKSEFIGDDYSLGRHVFHHFGSGTFAGAATYLGPKFIVNPILFNREYEELKSAHPIVYVNLNSPVTTPYDMLINQWLEQSRGDNRHGSCGVGIHETMVRSYPLEVSDLFGVDKLRKILNDIRQIYIPSRLQELNIPETAEIRRILFSEEFVGKFLDEARAFVLKVQPRSTKTLFQEYESVVFEGAQGLLLDEDFGRFPYVTHSNTGLKNVVELLKASEMDLEGTGHELNICYVTRWYLTRHGAGPFPNEYGTKPMYPDTMIEKTNVNNEWQGKFRYGYLDLNDLHARIEFDRTKYMPSYAWHKIQLAITCLDQSERNKFYHNGAFWDYPMMDFIETLREEMMLDKLYGSYGPSRNKVVEMKGIGA